MEFPSDFSGFSSPGLKIGSPAFSTETEFPFSRYVNINISLKTYLQE